ncbi:histidine phosphatase family protein [Streptomyces cavernae]|uniref:histidine phosphatase family protein n=1 Tax=Streptomyces cavernae TaxID=2259034 RepID=UPI000FEB70F9|nr:histidine phosphatase family protein [Streptomyces cavernae]
MNSRVMLISPAINKALREARFDDGCSLDPAGLRAAGTAEPPAADRSFTSPTARCRETAEALALDPASPPAPAGLAVGRWRGRTLAEVGAGEPESVAAWLADPTAAPHGGESVQELCTRVARWLDDLADASARTVAVVEPEVVRAAAVHVLGAPGQAFWRIDVPPLTMTELSGRMGRWNLRVGVPLGPRG